MMEIGEVQLSQISVDDFGFEIKLESWSMVGNYPIELSFHTAKLTNEEANEFLNSRKKYKVILEEVE